MKNCKQTESQSVLQHGFSVKSHLFELIDWLEGAPLKREWKIPDWLIQNKEMFLKSLLERKHLKLATIMHDCGKPFCEERDEHGKSHFPNHAKISHYIFVRLFDDELAAYLILHDMDIHLLKSEDVDEFSKSPYSLTQILIGLSELHSNASMFGGINSTSFKIKWKTLDARAKKLIKILNQNKN